MKYPIFYEYSKVPAFLSKFAPIKIYAISFGWWVWCRGPANTRIKNHERIHYLQQRELGFVLQWVLYLAFWLVLFVYYRDGARAYRCNAFEREAYDNDIDPHYLDDRKPFAWVRYILDPSREP